MPHAVRDPLAAIGRTICAQPGHARTLVPRHTVADGVRAQWPHTAAQIEVAPEAVLASTRVSEPHRRHRPSTPLLARVNQNLTQQSTLAGTCPSAQATLRLVDAILLDPDEAWARAGPRAFRSASMTRLRALLADASDQERLLAIARHGGPQV